MDDTTSISIFHKKNAITLKVGGRTGSKLVLIEGLAVLKMNLFVVLIGKDHIDVAKAGTG